MKNQRKLKLEDLAVKSFTTSWSRDESKTIKGGVTAPLGCQLTAKSDCTGGPACPPGGSGCAV